MDYISLGIVCEELERIDTAARVIMSVHLGLNSLALLQWGNEEQKEKYLTQQAKGKQIAAFGLTEPQAGSDVSAIQTTAKKNGNHYILNGEKTWISLADVADNHLVFAYTEKSKKHHGISAFIVEKKFEGVTSSTLHGKLGVRAGNTGSIALNEVKVPVENLLGQEGEGFKIAMSALDNGRFTVASGSVGIIQACLDESVKYANTRKTFGKKIGEHQLVQSMIAKMSASAEIGRLLYYRAGYMKNKGMRNTRETALAKWTNTEAAWRSADDAVQVHGAYGYSNEFPLERYLRNSRGAVIYEGSKEIQQIIQAEYALGYRKDKKSRCMLPKWPFEVGE
jgi:glutaryl-CoA dehydrogenase (non-decarboxylating)